jgi:ribosome-associated translation inhibitor RaiA/cold shock CspA family protein
MQVPLKITFKNMKHSDAIAMRIKNRAEWLERYSGNIISCRVVVEAPHKHHLKGNLFDVRINLRAPGAEIIVQRNPKLAAAHRDVYVAIRDAFDSARRELQDYTRRRRGDTKQLIRPPHGRVIRLAKEGEEFGFLQTIDGRELYFHRNSVLDEGFDNLQIGTEVRYSEEVGESGPQASSVEIVGAHKVRTAA